MHTPKYLFTKEWLDAYYNFKVEFKEIIKSERKEGGGGGMIRLI
jgi:hypothetical protein